MGKLQPTVPFLLCDVLILVLLSLSIVFLLFSILINIIQAPVTCSLFVISFAFDCYYFSGFLCF